jgi:hypothetical protein
MVISNREKKRVQLFFQFYYSLTQLNKYEHKTRIFNNLFNNNNNNNNNNICMRQLASECSNFQFS